MGCEQGGREQGEVEADVKVSWRRTRRQPGIGELMN